MLTHHCTYLLSHPGGDFRGAAVRGREGGLLGGQGREPHRDGPPRLLRVRFCFVLFWGVVGIDGWLLTVLAVLVLQF